MDKRQLKQAIAAAVLLLVACCTLYWAFTRTEEVPLVLSKAKLKGKITYNGKPVPHALIILSGESTSSTAQADALGNFLVEHAPPGRVSVGVNTEAAKGMMRGAMMSAAMSGNKSAMPTFVDVPAKFFDPNTSGITATVANSKGENTFDIVVK